MDKVLRTLTIKNFHVNDVLIGNAISIENKILSIDRELALSMSNKNENIKSVEIKVIRPKCHEIWTNSIMDIIPISTKVLGDIGEGITHTITGAYVMLTGCDEDGVQVSEFGSSEGILSQKLILNKAGTPGENDFIVNVDFVLKSGTIVDRKITTMMHEICDEFIQEIRLKLKACEGQNADSISKFEDRIREGKKKIIIIKQVGGQGAMHDNQFLSEEPSGFKGGKSNIDFGNIPILLSPNEYRDGAIRAMT